MSGCFKSNKVTLQRTMIPKEDSEIAGLPSMSKIKKFSSAIKNTIKKLKITRMAKMSKKDLKLSFFNPKTFLGFYYSDYYNFKNKDEDEAAKTALLVAEKR